MRVEGLHLNQFLLAQAQCPLYDDISEVKVVDESPAAHMPVHDRLRKRLRARSCEPEPDFGCDRAEGPAVPHIDYGVFDRVHAEIMRRHSTTFDHPPGDTDVDDLARHLRWWSTQCPPGEIDYADQENLALHAITFQANRRLFQRIDALPLELRTRLLQKAFEH